MPSKNKVNRRLVELAREHMGPGGAVTDWKEIAATMNAARLFNEGGGKWTAQTAASRYGRLKKTGLVPMPEPKPKGTTTQALHDPHEKLAEIAHTHQAETSHTREPGNEQDQLPAEGVTPEGQADMGMTPGEAITAADIKGLVVETVQAELHRIFHQFEPESVQRAGRGGKGATTVKKTVSVPADLWGHVEALGGIMSNHVSAALKIYLTLRTEGDE